MLGRDCCLSSPTSDAPVHALTQVTEEMLGKAARVAVSKERTTMIATGSHAGEGG